jgi:hypothetical protein
MKDVNYLEGWHSRDYEDSRIGKLNCISLKKQMANLGQQAWYESFLMLQKSLFPI